jgi:hypothetical protein
VDVTKAFSDLADSLTRAAYADWLEEHGGDEETILRLRDGPCKAVREGVVIRDLTVRECEGMSADRVAWALGLIYEGDEFPLDLPFEGEGVFYGKGDKIVSFECDEDDLYYECMQGGSLEGGGLINFWEMLLPALEWAAAPRNHLPIPDDFSARPLADGEKAERESQCGHCLLRWDEDETQTHGPRCPFEEFHIHPE